MPYIRRRPRSLLDACSRGDEEFALFLDFDGALVDIAATPDRVAAPPGLPDLLTRLSSLLGGALAIVSGRTIADIDLRLTPFRGRAAGIHGAEIRADPNGAIVSHVTDLEPEIADDVRRLTAFDSRILIENKGPSVAVHYRLADDLGPSVTRELANYAAARDDLDVLSGRKVVEVLRRRVSKGDAVAAFMNMPAFSGKRPIMIGDDHTDVSAFAACVAFQGCGLSVAGELFSDAAADFSGPEAVRFWLAEFASRLAILDGGRG